MAVLQQDQISTGKRMTTLTVRHTAILVAPKPFARLQ